MPANDFEFDFAEFAITTPDSSSLLAQRARDVRAAIEPDNILEMILASEIIHAGWEMERVRQLAHHRDSEPALAAANSRASRNWHRARKFLKKIQRADASRYCGDLNPEGQSRAASFPLADLTRLPKPFFLPSTAEKEAQ